jgi:hypothetical protein
MASCVCLSFLTPLQNFSDVKKRIEVSPEILKTLECLENKLEKWEWRNVYRCRECNQLWAEEYPFGEQQGGGRTCLYAIQTEDPNDWLKTVPDLTRKFRHQWEDERFWKQIGNESTAETCQHSGCSQLAVKLSSMCKRHHFEMVMGHAYTGPEA